MNYDPPNYGYQGLVYTPPPDPRGVFIREFVKAHYQPELAIELMIAAAKKLYDESLIP